jgi:hypothetical protein
LQIVAARFFTSARLTLGLWDEFLSFSRLCSRAKALVNTLPAARTMGFCAHLNYSERLTLAIQSFSNLFNILGGMSAGTHCHDVTLQVTPLASLTVRFTSSYGIFPFQMVLLQLPAQALNLN